MATLNFIPRSNYTIAVITLSFFHLIFYTVTATTIINNINGGFSAHLIRKNSPNSPFQEHKIQKNSRRLIGPDVLEASTEVDFDILQHVMKFSMGTPAFDIYAIADTGSDLIWTQCEPCKACFKSNFGIFDPRNSSTYKNITCGSGDYSFSGNSCMFGRAGVLRILCRLLGKIFPQNLPNMCIAWATRNCMYEYSYVDGSSTHGLLGKETVSLKSTTGEAVTLKNITFGCGIDNKEKVNTGNSMGFVGLGRGPLSFVSQIAPYVGGKRFSHCLVSDLNLESKIYFGNGSEVSGEGVSTVPLVDHETKYFVTVTGITIGNEFVPFDGKLHKKGNMLIDSGTPFPRLPRDIFDRVVTQLQKQVPLKSFMKHQDGRSTLCFNTTTPFNLPPVALNFENGGRVPLKNDNLILEESDGVCFTFLGVDKKYAVLGGIAQIDLLVGFDLERNIVFFKPTNCIDYNKVIA